MTRNHLIVIFLVISATLYQLGNAQTNCNNAGFNQCGTGVCAGYQYLNNRCILSAPGCSKTQYFSNSTNQCLSCLGLSSDNCITQCRSYHFFNNFQTTFTASGTLNTCRSCEDAFGLGCISCNSTNCISCESTSQLSFNRCIGIKCGATVQNCYTCSSENRCRLCLQGYDLNTTTFLCTLSASGCKIKYCLQCESLSNCSKCSKGYKLSSNKQVCEPECQDPNCVNCIAPGVCGGCASGYLLNPQTSVCHLNCTTNRVGNCHSCSNNFFCKDCNQGLHLLFAGSKCTRDCSDPNCNLCETNSQSCELCKTGFKLQNLQNGNFNCVADVCSIDNCIGCANGTACGSCFSAFRPGISNLVCSSVCTANCLTCSSNPNAYFCQTCQPGYILNRTQSKTSNSSFLTVTCEKIDCSNITNCSLCLTNQTCFLCQPNYRLSPDSKSCKLFCFEQCQQCLNTTFCSICKEGYTLIDGLCFNICPPGQVYINQFCTPCVDLDANCVQCATISGVPQCTLCKDSFFLDGPLSCKPCSSRVPNCLLCSPTLDRFTCLNCISPFKLSGGVCIQCDNLPNCQLCSALNKSQCANCSRGFRLVQGQCIPETCLGDTILLQGGCACALGTYLINQTNNLICRPCQQNCVRCNSSVCLECILQYYPRQNQCIRCAPSCLRCINDSFCLQCQSGYNLTSGKCVPSPSTDSSTSFQNLTISCPVGCLKCGRRSINSTEAVCIEPEQGHALINGIPVKCDSLCRTCSNFDPQICRSCFVGYALQNGQKCVPCADENALSCSPTNKNFSTSCKLQYTLRNSPGICTKCRAINCLKCDISSNTAQNAQCDPNGCDIGFFTDASNRCVNCFDNCPVCDPNSPSVCLNCATGRFLVNGTCFKCSDNCETCTNATFCTDCDSRYLLIRRSDTHFCHKKPSFPCAQLNQNTLNCGACFSSFNLINNVCEYDTNCNNTRTCVNCADELFLSNRQCLSCVLGPNCRRCRDNGNKNCLRCINGYYLDDGQCFQCQLGCLKCKNKDFCQEAVEGRYIKQDFQRLPTGVIGDCESPCRTCQSTQKFCLSCIDGFSLKNAKCFSQRLVIITIVFTPLQRAYYNNSQNDDQKLASALRNMYTIRQDICSTFPLILKRNDDQICTGILNILGLKIGSLNMNIKIGTSQIEDGDVAERQILGAFENRGVAGATVQTSQVSRQGYSESDSVSSGSNLNLGLILGVSIPLGLLFILIIIFLIYYYRDNDRNEEVNEKYIYYEEVNQYNQFNI